MYKNISFQEAEFGEKKFLMYRVDDASQMDHVEVEMLKNNDIKGLLPFSSAQNNDEIKFMYEMTNKMKLSQFLGGLVRWEELYPAVQGIVAAIMDCEQYMLNEGHFVLETENIFIDLSSRKIELMFLPVENELLAQITWKDFLITLLHNINYDMKDDIGKLETLQSYLADEKITIKEYAEKIEKIETLGLARNKDVKKENRQSERPVREVKREEKPNVIYNVPDPNSEISSDVMKTEKEEKKEGIIGLFSKKKKKEKKQGKKQADSFAFEIPGQKKSVDVSKKKEKEAVQEIGETLLADDSEASLFMPYLIDKKTNGQIPINKKDFKIGREEKYVDYVTSEPTVGRLHASIVLDEQGKIVFVRDANSKNGTFVNGEKIQSNINVQIKDGDVIRFGRDEYMLQLR